VLASRRCSIDFSLLCLAALVVAITQTEVYATLGAGFFVRLALSDKLQFVAQR
jgi:hypothetical protein